MYGFVSGVSTFAGRPVAAGAKCVGRSLAVKAPSRAQTRGVVKMTWEGRVPPTTVLGIGKDIPGPVFLMASVICLFLGGYCVYQQNLNQLLTAATISPVYVVGSLLLPISWGCHVAAWIKFKNQKK
mmetsp:Transcript_399/g.1365  ORF Transcript_399/g.1365 Transcript_399/m.1365 type:complete len:126 (+) Transcript_399:144-521(+)